MNQTTTTSKNESIIIHMANQFNRYGERTLSAWYNRLGGFQIYPPMMVALIEDGLVERVKVGREIEYSITDAGLEEASTALFSMFGI